MRHRLLLLLLLHTTCAFSQMVSVPQTYLPRVSNVYSLSYLTLDATNTRIGLVFNVPQSGSITDIGLAIRSVTSCTGCVLRVSIQSVDGSGYPSGSYYGGSSYVERTGLAAATPYIMTLGTPATATAGDVVAVVMEWGSVSGTVEVACAGQIGESETLAIPYGISYVSGTWQAISSRHYRRPAFAVKYGSAGWIHAENASVYSAIGGFTFSSSAANRGYGMKFRLPFTARMTGLWTYVVIGSGATMTCELMNADRSSTITTLVNAHDGDQVGSASAAPAMFRFAPLTLQAETWYNIICYGGTSTNSTTYYGELPSSGAYNELRGANVMGTSSYWVEKGSSSYTERLHRTPQMGIIVNGIGIGTGGFVTAQ